MAHRACIRSRAMNCVCSVSFNGNPGHHASRSCPSVGRRSRLRGSPAWLSVPVNKPNWASKFTRTCYGTPAGTLWPIRATTRVRSRLGSVTETSRTRSGIVSLRRIALETSGEGEALDSLRPKRFCCGSHSIDCPNAISLWAST